MSKRDVEIEYDEPKEKVIVKKKGGFWGRFFSWFFGFLFGIIFTVGGVAGAGWYIYAKMKIEKGVNTINKLTGAGIDYTEYLDGSYGDKTIKYLMGDVIDAVENVSNGTGTLADLNEISPLVTTLLEGEDGNGGLIATLKKYNIETTKEELMSKIIINTTDEEDPETYLLDYLIDKAKALPVRDVLELVGYSTGDSGVLKYVLDYTDADGNPFTIGTLFDNQADDFFAELPIGDLLLNSSFEIPEDMQDLVYTLLYGENYEIDETTGDVTGDDKLTVNNVSEALTRLYGVPLDALMPVDADDTLMCILAYGGKDRYDAAADEMKQVYYTYDSAANKLYDADGNDVTANIVAESLDIDTENNTATCQVSFTDGEATVTHYLKASEVSADGTQITFLAYTDNTYSETVLFEKTTIQDLLDGNLLDGLLDHLTLGDVIEIDETDPNTMDILIKLKDTPISQLKNEINNLTLGDVIEIDENSHEILQKLKNTPIKDLESQVEDAIATIKLGEVMEITTSSPLVLQNLQDTAIGDLSNAFNKLTLDKVIEINDDSHVVLQKIKEKGILISELGTRLGEVVDEIKINEIIDVGDNKVLNAIGGFTIAELPNKIDELTIGQLVEVGDNKLLNAISGFTLAQLPSKIDTLTIGQLVEVGDNKILNAISGFTLGQLPTQITTLKIKDVIDVGDNKILNAIGGYTLDELPANVNTAINGLQLKDVITNIPEDSILSNLADTKIGDLPTAINNLKIVDVFANEITYLTFKASDVQDNKFISVTEHVYSVTQNADGKYTYTDANGNTVVDGDYINKVGNLLTGETRMLSGMWSYLLNDYTGVKKPEDYTITQMSDLVANMSHNMQNATLNQMAEDEIFVLEDESLLTTEIHYSFLQYEVPFIYYQDTLGNYTDKDGNILYKYAQATDGTETYTCQQDGLVFTKTTQTINNVELEFFVDSEGTYYVTVNADGTYHILPLPHAVQKTYYGELTMKEMIDHLTMIIKIVPEGTTVSE